MEVGRDDVHRVVHLKAEKKQRKWFTSRMLPDFCKGIAFVGTTPRFNRSSFSLRVAVKNSEVLVSMMYKNPIRSSQKTLHPPYKGQSVNAVVAYISCLLSEWHKMQTHKVRAKCRVVTLQKVTRTG